MKLLIVDDHQILRAGLELIFETVPDIEVVGLAPDGQTGLDLVATTHPDVVLTDIRMPKMDGIALLKHLHATQPALPVVVLTTFDDQEPIQQAMQLGAKGFLLKDADQATILKVIRGAVKGETYLEPRIAGKAFAPQPPAIDLTLREQAVLTQVAQGLHSKEIAANLKVSERTIKAHLTSIYNKLGVFSRAEAVAKALQLNLIDL